VISEIDYYFQSTKQFAERQFQLHLKNALISTRRLVLLSESAERFRSAKVSHAVCMWLYLYTAEVLWELGWSREPFNTNFNSV